MRVELYQLQGKNETEWALAHEECRDWLAALVFKGAEVVVPEIADYEVRRELLRAEKPEALPGWTQ